jgi:toxin ParE1/3/4
VNRPVVFSPEAQNDLLDLYEYIADHSSSARALRYIERIEKMCNALNFMPERGTRREDLRPGLRVTGFEHRVLIAFQVRPESVAILRLLYGGRSVELAFSQDDE